ncbi:hypothetical protein SUGI_0262410 [Cryptomeria japonica]|uniref:uncharacterized protein LOC131035092 n=1 Tax=Cryptomeria japonica TaxID=3369 RepID=UPI002408B240|nr:uncharacterized protein LOC131035092 [Cryptomeria japonica]GLJ15891.1 hypothetical protein SUGI_0262410 [Cryptomeria japonica]
MELQIVAKESDKEQRERDRDHDLTSLTDGELDDRIKRIFRLIGLKSCHLLDSGHKLNDSGHKLRLFLQKNLDERKRRQDLAKVRSFGNVVARLHLKSGCLEGCKDEAREQHIVAKESDKEQRERDRDHDLTNLTDGELDDRIKRIFRLKGLKSFQLFDTGHKLCLYLQKNLDERKRRLDERKRKQGLAKVGFFGNVAAGLHLKSGYLEGCKDEVRELHIGAKESSKEQRECDRDHDLSSLTDGELDDKIKRILRLIGLMSWQSPDAIHKLYLYLQKNLDEKKRRRDLTEIEFFDTVMAGIHLKSGCLEECKDLVTEPHIMGEESEKEKRECDRDHDLTSLTDGELDDKIETMLRLKCLSYRLPDRGHKLCLYLEKHLDEKKRRKEVAKVSLILEIPEDRFLILLKEGLTTVYKEEAKRAHFDFLLQGRNNLNEKEMDVLKDYMKSHNMMKLDKKRKAEPTGKERYEPVIKDPDASNLPDPLIGTYDIDQHEASSKRCCWE